MNEAITSYNQRQSIEDQKISVFLAKLIDKHLTKAEGKIWHAHPVWFIKDNPIVGYSKQKAGIRLMFWSGTGFEEARLNVRGKKFKDASIFYTSVDEINPKELQHWLGKAEEIQWDYKNIIKRKGRLERIK